MRHQHVLNRVVVDDLPIGLRVVRGSKVAVDERIVAHGGGKAHQHAAAHMTVHHLRDIRQPGTVRLEVLNMKMLIVIEARARLLCQRLVWCKRDSEQRSHD